MVLTPSEKTIPVPILIQERMQRGVCEYTLIQQLTSELWANSHQICRKWETLHLIHRSVSRRAEGKEIKTSPKICGIVEEAEGERKTVFAFVNDGLH